MSQLHQRTMNIGNNKNYKDFISDFDIQNIKKNQNRKTDIKYSVSNGRSNNEKTRNDMNNKNNQYITNITKNNQYDNRIKNPSLLYKIPYNNITNISKNIQNFEKLNYKSNIPINNIDRINPKTYYYTNNINFGNSFDKYKI